MKKIILYYLSGTGNTYRTAVCIKDAALKSGIDASLIPIEKASPRKEITGDDTEAGFGMPTHGFTLPWMMLKFLFNLPRGWQKCICMGYACRSKVRPYTRIPSGNCWFIDFYSGVCSYI